MIVCGLLFQFILNIFFYNKQAKITLSNFASFLMELMEKFDFLSSRYFLYHVYDAFTN